MARTFRIQYTVTAVLTINRDDIVSRVRDEEWQRLFYAGMTEEDAADMVTMQCGIEGARLDHLDGWADCGPDDVACDVQYDLDGVAEVEREEQTP